jgi:hypothetical protein
MVLRQLPRVKSTVLHFKASRAFFNIQYVKEHFGGAGRNRTYIVGFSVRCLDQLGNRSGYFFGWQSENRTRM